MQGYERLLEKYPDLRSKTVFYQLVAPPQTSVVDGHREALKSRLEREIARICGRFSTANWTPVRYIYRHVSQHDLVSMYARASVGVVAPVSDGMSQVARELVACGGGGGGSPALVMSVFGSDVGTMGSLEDTVVLVNPLERDLMADGLKSALDMAGEERRARLASLKACVKRSDVNAWFSAVVDAAAATLPPPSLPPTPPPLPVVVEQVVKLPPPILISTSHHNVKSAFERHQESIVKNAIKNIV